MGLAQKAADDDGLWSPKLSPVRHPLVRGGGVSRLSDKAGGLTHWWGGAGEDLEGVDEEKGGGRSRVWEKAGGWRSASCGLAREVGGGGCVFDARKGSVRDMGVDNGAQG